MHTMTDGFFSMRTSCPKCNGTGHIVDPCKSCGGKGVQNGVKTVKVDIPAGVENGQNIRVPSQGSSGEKGGKAGNLYLNITVEEDPVFKRDGLNLHVEAPINVSLATLGGFVTVPTLEGSVEVKIPPGTQPMDSRILRNKGVKSPHQDRYGHQYIYFKVTIPMKMTQKQRELMEEFAKEEEAPQRSPSSKSFFELLKGFLKKE